MSLGNIERAKANLKHTKWLGKLKPTFILPGTYPVALGSAEVRRAVGAVLEGAVSAHSGAGATLWAVLDYLQGMGVPYELRAWPGEGYEVRLLSLAGKTGNNDTPSAGHFSES